MTNCGKSSPYSWWEMGWGPRDAKRLALKHLWTAWRHGWVEPKPRGE